MRNEFTKAFNEYRDQINLPFKPTDNSFAKFFLNEIPEIIIDQVGLNNNRFKVQSSVGQGNWTETPWISVFDCISLKRQPKGFI